MEYFDTYLSAIGFSALLFVILILLLAIPPKYTKKALGWIAVGTVIAALGMYGFGHGYLFIQKSDNHSTLTCILRTVFDSCRIFVGANNWDKIKVAYNESPLWECLFWIIHLLAMATSASAVVVSLGSRLLKKLRLWGLRMHDIALIYGLNENTLEFGRALAKNGKIAILFVDQIEKGNLQANAEQMGAVFRSDADALSGNIRFLKSIGMKSGKRKLHVYALDRSLHANGQFARKLMVSLEARGIDKKQTSITLLSVSEETDTPLQATPKRYGYGSVYSINEPEMAARLLIRNYPPYKSLSFDSEGKALQDFHGVIIGFGQVGQAVLRQLVMNSQFCGSTGTIAVFAPDYESRMGWLSHECREMLSHYNIALHPYDGRSRQLYDYLDSHAASIHYIAVCAGSETNNVEISERLQPFLQRRNCSAPVLLCSIRGISHMSANEHLESHRIYTPEILCSDQIDRMAMILHHSYCDGGEITENWRNCGYFNRVSSRAAADFRSALLGSAGVTEKEARESWDPQGELLENLSETEHLRWVAFHYCMGFRPMTETEFRQRAEEYLAEKEKNPATEYRITLDRKKRIHACMIPWEALDSYSQKENAVTGGTADYAENDRKNVRNLNKLQDAVSRS